jgi:hypothetical protein
MIDGATAKLIQLRDLLDRMVDAIITIGRAMGWIGAAGAIGGGLVWLAVLSMTSSSSTPTRGFVLVLFAFAPLPGLFLLWWRRKLLAATALRVGIADRVGTMGTEVTSVTSDLPRGPWHRLVTLAWRARTTVGSMSDLAMDVTPVVKAGNPWVLMGVVISLPLAITLVLVAPLALFLAAIR